jgi:uncharacterized protein YggL (DUF469 family)
VAPAEQLGFVVRFHFVSPRGGLALVELMSALGDDLCRSRALGFKGGGDMQDVELTMTRTSRPLTDEDRDAVSRWLQSREGVRALEVGPLTPVES